LLAGNPHGGEHLKELLAGQILWVGWEALPAGAAIYTLVLALWFFGSRRLGAMGFYLMFALTVTVSVQWVGVFLVFASLIAPAVATRRWSGHLRLASAYAVGVAGYGGGLWASVQWDLPAGAAVVCALVGCVVLLLLLTGFRVGRVSDGA
ncbi:MAG: metal ABC transporter permease, partial [Rhodocyclaceae bacterium]|nr:metal ABC transporter permease [Rhodocyclaceae bacterium]